MKPRLRFTAALIAVVVVVGLLVLGGRSYFQAKAQRLAEQKHAAGISQMLCKGIQAYRQRTGELPASLDAIVEQNLINASSLRDATNSAAVTYEPGANAGDNLPSLAVSYRGAWIQVHGPEFRYP